MFLIGVTVVVVIIYLLLVAVHVFVLLETPALISVNVVSCDGQLFLGSCCCSACFCLVGPLRCYQLTSFHATASYFSVVVVAVHVFVLSDPCVVDFVCWLFFCLDRFSSHYFETLLRNQEVISVV